LNHHFGDVSEDDEEQISDSSIEKKQNDINKGQKKSNKTYSIGYLTKKLTKKIYSDDFDADYELMKNKQKEKFQIGSVVKSEIKEDVEISEIENPYFSDNSSSSHLTSRRLKFNIDWQKLLDKSDNESSAQSVGAQRGNKHSKLGFYQTNVNEPIEEVEDEKEEIGDLGRQPISDSIRRRRKTSKHIDKSLANYLPSNRSIIYESDTIHEEIGEIEDEEPVSENNFYSRWNNRNFTLLTQDE